MEPDLISTRAAAPPNSRPGACWGKDVTPAIVETVTEQVMLQPAEVTTAGAVDAPAIYKTEIRQQILRERRELWFEIPCGLDSDAVLITTLQRALAARGLYSGTVTGQYDARTRAAVRRYQADQGLDSGLLSTAAARQLGLVTVPIE
jgi:peptidoglycan hydrolase-like protein with peptidoglycan-binding domain